MSCTLVHIPTQQSHPQAQTIGLVLARCLVLFISSLRGTDLALVHGWYCSKDATLFFFDRTANVRTEQLVCNLTGSTVS